MALRVEEKEGVCTFRVHLLPRSRKDEIVGLHGDALKVRLTAVPVRGKANRALERFLAQRLSVPPAAVAIVSGHASRRKRVRVSGATAARIVAALDPSSAGSPA